jgi:hypothetical protein
MAESAAIQIILTPPERQATDRAGAEERPWRWVKIALLVSLAAVAALLIDLVS